MMITENSCGNLQFSEELAVDDDSFDYNFYTYGLRLSMETCR